jgi:outer membrane lipoprotein SlyB
MRVSVPLRRLAIAIAGCILAGAIEGCATTKRPVLYPNDHYESVGEAAARRDVDECMERAKASGNPETKQGEVPKRAATGAAVGGAAAGAWGLVTGNALERAAAGAAAGAAGGAVSGAINSTDTDPIFRNFVQKCLRDRGYEVIGWR